MIAYTPDLMSAIQLGVKYDGIIISHERAGFKINGTKAKYWQRFTDKPAEGRDQAEFISFTQALSGFRLAAGNDWASLEIHLQSNYMPDMDTLITCRQ